MTIAAGAVRARNYFRGVAMGCVEGIEVKVTEATPVTAMCRRKGICVFRQSVLYIRALISCGHIFVHLKYDYHTSVCRFSCVSNVELCSVAQVHDITQSTDS